ncbi:hypothetical protein C2S51_009958 [Perilla frutescens var. frutescens]|nr:hypothetical protein C2S51_009958 [Perilla frutescens var. frutescens]
MAEVAVATALGLIQIITPLLSTLNLQTDLKKKDIESMRSWLSSMLAFMEDADMNHRRQRSRTATLTDLIGKVRTTAYQIEDVVDDFLLHSPPYTFHRHRASRKLHTFAHTLRHGLPLRGVAEKIASIRKDIEDITSQSSAFGDRSNSYSHSNSTILIRPNPLLRDDEMVGYDISKAELMRRLVDAAGEKRLVTVAVDGPGGSGKTTLVKNVFWKPQIQSQFDCHAWVCVSDQNSDIEKIAENLLKQLCSSRKEAYVHDDGSPVLERLQSYLRRKRYLVVLDDLLKDEYWSCFFKHALPDSSNGSRVIVTTMYSNVSSICASSQQDHRYSLPGLEFPDQWKLFCRRAFPDNGECPSELKDTCRKIVARCEGLPLAIVTVAGALASKPHIPTEWERFHDNLGNEIRHSSSLSPINNALLRSYMDLSCNLKCCFLYFSIFPEDYSIERGRLIRLWVAERFAVETEDNAAEEVAESYLNELIQRNLVHVSIFDFDGRPRNCRVLNLVLKFIIQKCKDENFASIFPRENAGSSSIQNQSQMMIRRLSVHNHCQHLPGNADLATVRSMLLLRLSEICSSDFERCLGKLKLIKVMDVQGAPLTKFPKEITRFTLVRYLSFRETKIQTIPSSIEKLSYLETLDLKQTEVTELPKEISHLHNLCHLLVYKYNVSNYVDFESVEGVKLHEGIDKLTLLQNLSLVKVDRKGRILKDLKGLIHLRKLGLMGLKQEHCKYLCSAVQEMKSLKTLDVCSATKEEFLELTEMISPPSTLQRLYLKGRLQTLPNWISNLDYLVRIGLKWSKLRDSPLQILKCLRNLTELQLVDCFVGEELTFEASGFKKMKILTIEDLTNLKMIVIENGAMPELKQISIRRCREMKMLLGLDKLIKVEELTLYDMAEEFVARLRINGDDRASVKHVPLIHSFTLGDQCWSLENLSDFVSYSR